jgi:hypothetical protein
MVSAYAEHLMGKVEVGGAAGEHGEMAEHLKKLTGGAIRRATVAIWWKKGVPLGNGATRRRGGDLVGVRDAMADFGREW